MKRVASTSTMREDASRCNFTANVKPDLLHTRVNASNTPDKAFENKAHIEYIAEYKAYTNATFLRKGVERGQDLFM